MAILLETTIKDGKLPIKVSITADESDQALAEYQKITSRFAGVSGEKAAPEATKVEKTTENKVVDINKPVNARQAKKISSQQLIELNEIAIQWANRMAVVIPQFNGKLAQQLVEQLNFRKPMAQMEIPELQEVIQLIRSTLGQYAENNPAASAYLTVVRVIDSLESGTDEEWQQKRSEISDQAWAVLSLPANQGMLTHAKQQLEQRQRLLQAANSVMDVI